MKTDRLAGDTDRGGSLPLVRFRQREDGGLSAIQGPLEALTGLAVPLVLSEPGTLERCLLDGEARRREAYQEKVRSGAGAGQPCALRLRHQVTGMIHEIVEWGDWDEGRGYEGIWLDLSLATRVRQRLERSLWQDNLIGLSGGLVHDLNNVLAGIGSLVELGLMDLAEDHPMRPMMGQLKENTFRATGLTQHMMRLLHFKSGSRTLLDLNTLVEETVSLLRRSVPRHIELVKALSPEALPLEGDKAELQQLLISLVNNARQSIRGKGRIEMVTGFYGGVPKKVGVVLGEAIPESGIQLTVRDNGCGIVPERLEAITKLSYTTKPKRQGVGLGLHHARHCCSEHGGALSVETEPGRGTAVHLWLPRADLDAYGGEDPSRSGRKGKIRLVAAGDPEIVSDALLGVLEAQGVEVLQVPEPEVFRVALSGWENFHGLLLGVRSRSLEESSTYAIWRAFGQFKLSLRFVLLTEPGGDLEGKIEPGQVVMEVGDQDSIEGIGARILEMFRV